MNATKRIEIFIDKNGIDKKQVALKMGISVKELDKIFNTPNNVLESITYYKLITALNELNYRVSADEFFIEKDNLIDKIHTLENEQHEQLEDIKEIAICISDEISNLKNSIDSVNRKLESEKISILKIQNQISIVNLIIPETEKEIERLKRFIEKVES